jgi:hypothetical protein
MPNDLNTVQEEELSALADAPWLEPPSDEELDEMYEEWCARHHIEHKDHHYW